MRRLVGDDAGGVAVYSAVLLGFSLGLGTIAIDFGRAVLLRSQMQNYADAAALAGALHLDGRAGARARATEVAREAIEQRSAMVDEDTNLATSAVVFYQSPDVENGRASCSELVHQYVYISLVH